MWPDGMADPPKRFLGGSFLLKGKLSTRDFLLIEPDLYRIVG